jgi:hypothetical protein
MGDQVLLYPGKYIHPAGQEQFERSIGAGRPDQFGATHGTREK